MKKFRWSIYIAVLAFIIFYVGASYYMGYAAKSRIKSLVQNFEHDKELIVRLVAYDQGIFSSDIKLEVSFNELNTYTVNLKLTHRSLIVYKNGNDDKLQILLFKFLADTSVTEIFLDNQSEIIRNVSVINPLEDISLNIKLLNFAADTFKNLGLNSDRTEYNDGMMQFKINNGGFGLNLTGYGENLWSNNKHHQLQNAKFSVFFNYNKNNNLRKNDYGLELSANDVVVNTNKVNQVFSNPRMKLDFNGDLMDFLEILRNKLMITDLNALKYPFIAKLAITNDQAKLINVYKDELNFKSIDTSLTFDNTTQNNKIAITSFIGNFDGQNKLDKINVNKFKIDFGTELDKSFWSKIFDNFEESTDDITEYSKDILDHILENKQSDIFGNFSLKADSVTGKGLVLGNVNFDDFEVYFNLDKEKNNKKTIDDLIFSSKFNIDKLNWKFEDANNQLNIKDTSLKYDEYFNITQRFKQPTDTEIKPYDSSYAYDINSPMLLVRSGSFSTSFEQIDAKGDFEMNQETTGFLNNNIKIEKFKLSIDSFSSAISKINIASAMQQKYKFILAGTNTLKTDSIDLKYNNSNFLTEQFGIASISKINDDKLIYDNSLNLIGAKFDDQKYGNMYIDSKIYDISIFDYEQLMTSLNKIFVKKYIEPNGADEEIETYDALVYFLAQGFKIDTVLGLIDNPATSEQEILNSKGIKIVKIVRLASTNLDNLDENNSSPSDKLGAILNNFSVGLNVMLSKPHIEKLLQLFANPELNKLYEDLKNTGILVYKNENADIDLFYTAKKFMINNKDLVYWQSLIKSKKIKTDFITRLQELEAELN